MSYRDWLPISAELATLQGQLSAQHDTDAWQGPSARRYAERLALAAQETAEIARELSAAVHLLAAAEYTNG